MIALLDVRAGGTWLGLNGFGVFGAVTNLRCESPDAARRSRGMIVVEALRAPSAERAADALKTLPADTYNPFHCYVADRERAFLLSYRDAPRLRELEPGVHVVGNRDPQEEPAEKVERVRAAAERMAEKAAATDVAMFPVAVLDGLAAVFREHGTGGGGLGDTCVHCGDYGTRSSALLLLADEPAESQLRFASGAPCEAPYEDLSTLLREQCRRAGRSGETAVRKAS